MKKAHEILAELGVEVDVDSIREIRVLRKINQETMAEQMGMHLQAYQRRETGKVEFSSKELKTVSFILGEPVDFFYTDYNPVEEARAILGQTAKRLSEKGVQADVVKRGKRS